jgi:hypothetical protein
VQKKKIFGIILSLFVFCIVMIPLFVIAMDAAEGEGTVQNRQGSTNTAMAEGNLDSTEKSDVEGTGIVNESSPNETEKVHKSEIVDEIDEIDKTDKTGKTNETETVGEIGTADETKVVNESEKVVETSIEETEIANNRETVDEENSTETADETETVNGAEKIEERKIVGAESHRTPTAEEIGFPTKDELEQSMQAGLMSVNTGSNGYAIVTNDFIEYAVNRSGRFTIGTTGGDPDNPKDNNKKMLYGHQVSNSGGTSYTTVRVDGIDYIYTIDDYSRNSVDEINNTHTSAMTINGILQVTQELSIVQNSTTQRPDTVQIRYIVKNMDTKSHSLGLRIMLDTMLGNNDYAPFKIPGYGDLTKQKEFAEDNIPQYWQAFDSLAEPSVIASGTLIKSIAEAPSRVHFTNWGIVRGTPWGHVPDEEKDNRDSAVCVIWDEETMEAGETKTFVTYYGLSSFETTQTEKILVSLSAPKALAADESEQFYEPDPFRISLYVKNISGEAITNAKARIMLPTELRLFGTSDINEIPIEDLSSLAEKQISWLLYADAQVESTEVTLKIVVTADDLEDIIISHKLYLPRLINGVASYSVKMGNQFEQTVYPDRTVTPPRIKNVHIESITSGKYRLSLEENDYSVSSKAYPFFCWEALEGSFELVDESFQTVIYNVPTGTQGRRLLLKAHLGDGLGHAVEYKFWVDGIN